MDSKAVNLFDADSIPGRPEPVFTLESLDPDYDFLRFDKGEGVSTYQCRWMANRSF
jgi:hypothetical protein